MTGQEADHTGCEKENKKTKRMTGVDEDFLRVFAKSERGLDAATEAETDLDAVTGFGDDRNNRKGRGAGWETDSVK